jgi:hypothetical protein
MIFRTKEQKAKDREQNRYYLFPGQGGRAYHRKQRYMLLVAVLVGLLVSAIVMAAIWFSHHPWR